MHKRFVINIISRILLIVCYVMTIPLLWAVADDRYSLEVKAFSMTIMFGIIFFGLLRFCFKLKTSDYKRLNAKDGLAIVGLSWISLSLFGAIPLYLAEVVPSYTDAFFEIASGFTTTGSSVISDIESLPRGILFWRSLTHWIGGMGIIVLYIALLPAIGSSAFQLYKAEAPGLTVERIEPRLKETAKNLWAVYFILSLAELILLMFGKMPIFDALCHTFGTMATGGFSTKNISMAAYGPYIQWVVIVFMFLAGANFILHYQVFIGKPLKYFKNEEFRWYFLIVVISVLIFSAVLYGQGLSTSPIRDSAFQVVAIISTTGFTTADFNVWPQVLKFILIILMFVGGCGGSTGGGMKVVRHILAVKISIKSLVQAVYPNAILPVKFNGKPMAEKLVLAVLSYFIIFIVLMFLGTLFLTATESCDIITAFTCSISSLSNIGPGLNKIGPTENFAWVSNAGKWMLTLLMLIGRLELYSILILFIPTTWKK